MYGRLVNVPYMFEERIFSAIGGLFCHCCWVSLVVEFVCFFGYVCFVLFCVCVSETGSHYIAPTGR